MKKHVHDFLNQTFDARIMSEKCRDYYDNKQWTDEEVSTLRARGQAAITYNRVKTKVQGLKGLYISRRTDPKAYARTPKHEKSSQAITDALRYVKDVNKLDHIKVDVADNFFVEGYGGVIVTDRDGEPKITQIPWDRIYFDPHSRRKDFKDARYMGIVMWMGEEEFNERFPNSKFEDCLLNSSDGDETFEDRPRWVGGGQGNKRVRVAQEFFKEKGTWKMCYFCGDHEIIKKQDSPFLDEDGEPTNPIELVGSYIDRDNQRFGEVLYFLDVQDEINHRRSKALALLSHRQTAARRGAITDIRKMKRELSDPLGHVEYNGERGDFEVLQTNDMAQGQFELMQQSMQEMDATSFNAELAGQRQGDLSGNAVEKLQSAGLISTEELFFCLKDWEERVYTQIWWRILTNWDEEKWVKVTDDYKNLRYVGFNVEVTFGERLKEVVEDKSLPESQRMQAAQVLQLLTQAQDPRLGEMVEVQNPIPELEMDIIIDHAPDTINIQNEQFRMIAEIAQARPEIPVYEVLELSQLRNKDEIIQRLMQRERAMMQAQQQAMQSQEQRENAKVQSQVQRDSAAATNTNMDTIRKQIETIILQENPEKVTSISV